MTFSILFLFIKWKSQRTAGRQRRRRRRPSPLPHSLEEEDQHTWNIAALEFLHSTRPPREADHWRSGFAPFLTAVSVYLQLLLFSPTADVDEDEALYPSTSTSVGHPVKGQEGGNVLPQPPPRHRLQREDVILPRCAAEGGHGIHRDKGWLPHQGKVGHVFGDHLLRNVSALHFFQQGIPSRLRLPAVHSGCAEPAHLLRFLWGRAGGIRPS